MSPKHSNTDIGWIKREFAAIRKQMREDRAAKKLQASTIGKGGLTIREGGQLISRYPVSMGGGPATTFGPQEEGGEFPGYVFALQDETGRTIFAAIRNVATGDVPDGASMIISSALHILTSKNDQAFLFIANDDIELDHLTGAIRLNGTTGTYIQHSTTGTAANCFIDPSDGRIWRSTSSRRYKRDIEDAPAIDPAAVLQMRPRTWRDKVDRDSKDPRRSVGFIAEELHDLGLTAFVEYEPFWTCRDCEVTGEGWPTREPRKPGSALPAEAKNPADAHEAETGHTVRRTERPDSIAYDRLSVALLAVLKDQDARLKALESAKTAKPTKS